MNVMNYPHLKDAINHFSHKLHDVAAFAEVDWGMVQFELGETPNDVYGFCRYTANIDRTGRKKRFVSVDKSIQPKIVLNARIYEHFPELVTDLILPHEMGHACQWFANRQPDHDQFFKWVMRKLGVSQSATFNSEDYGMTEDQRNRLNLLTGKQKKVLITHIPTQKNFVITANIWTRMLTRDRRLADGTIISRKNCKVIMDSDSL